MRDNQPSEEERGFMAFQNRETEYSNEKGSVADGGHQINELLEMIADKRRRYLLYSLQHQRKVEFDEVTNQVATWETKTLPQELDKQARQNIQVDLRHTHLPKLEDAGIIRFDHQNSVIYLHHLPDTLEEFLDYCAVIEHSEESL